MSLFRWGIIILVVGALLVGGVVEVTFHPDQLANVPGRVLDTATSGAVREQVRGKVVSWKRVGEQWIIGDEEKKLQLAIGYIESDAERLTELAETGSDSADSILPQAELLVSSIERSSTLTNSVSVEVLADARDETKASLRAAASALGQLRSLKEELFSLNERFAAVTDQLEGQVGDIRLADEPDKEGAVAGTSDGEVTEEAASQSEEIPLEF